MPVPPPPLAAIRTLALALTAPGWPAALTVPGSPLGLVLCGLLAWPSMGPVPAGLPISSGAWGPAAALPTAPRPVRVPPVGIPSLGPLGLTLPEPRWLQAALPGVVL